MSKEFDHTTFISPFTWRYGTSEMRTIFSEVHKRKLLRRLWLALAKAQMRANLVTKEQVADLEAHVDSVDIERASEIEKSIKHDLMAEIMTYAEQCTVGGSIIHLGATSMDILDNVDILRQKEALKRVILLIKEILQALAVRMESEASTISMAFTHIQPAEPTTIGYRLAQTAQDLLDDLEDAKRLYSQLKGKGFKGAVGTSASYNALLEKSEIDSNELEQIIGQEIGLSFFEVSTQVYPRKQDLKVGSLLYSLSATIAKFALDLRLLQSPPIGEWSEPFSSKQVGSSAMPFKRNPIISEKINSLCRFIAAQNSVLWDNAANMMLERTLDDSANRRLVIPELFLATDEILISTLKLVKEMNFHPTARTRNLEKYGVFAASERLLMELGRRGANRQQMHELIREHSLEAWKEVQSGKENPLSALLAQDKRIRAYLSEQEILLLMDASDYIGEAVKRTLSLCKRIALLEDK